MKIHLITGRGKFFDKVWWQTACRITSDKAPRFILTTSHRLLATCKKCKAQYDGPKS